MVHLDRNVGINCKITAADVVLESFQIRGVPIHICQSVSASLLITPQPVPKRSQRTVFKKINKTPPIGAEEEEIPSVNTKSFDSSAK